jgi:hypothetical protein
MQSSSRIALDSHPRITMPLINSPNLDFADQLPTVRPPDEAGRVKSVIEKRTRGPRRTLLIAGWTCVGIGLLAVAMLLLTQRRDSIKSGQPSHDKLPVSNASASSAPISSVAPVAQLEVPAPVVQTEVQGTGVRSGSTNTVSRSQPKPDATSSAKSSIRTSPADASKTSGKAKAKADCAPPYYLDSKGIRRLKPECM